MQSQNTGKRWKPSWLEVISSALVYAMSLAIIVAAILGALGKLRSLPS